MPTTMPAKLTAYPDNDPERTRLASVYAAASVTVIASPANAHIVPELARRYNAHAQLVADVRTALAELAVITGRYDFALAAACDKLRDSVRAAAGEGR